MSGPRAGPYHTTSGPLDGPIRRCHGLPAVGVYSADSGPWPIGIAMRVGEHGGPDDRIMTFRLEVDGVELDGTYVVIGRQFVPAEGMDGE